MSGGGASRWLYVGEDAEWALRAQTGEFAELERVPLGALLAEAAERLRGPYIDWIGELSRENASLEWWASELAAKNPFARLFPRLCAVAAAREAVDDGMLVVCSTPAVAEALRDVAPDARVVGPAGPERWKEVARRGLGAWSRVAPGALAGLPGRVSEGARRALDDSHVHRRRVLDSLGVGRGDPPRGVLLFTWIDDRSVPEGGAYVDPHFGPLPELLRSRGVDVWFVPRVLTVSASFGDAVRKLLATKEQFVFPDSWVEPADWREAERRAREFAPVIPDDAVLAGVPVAGLAREHVEEYRWLQHMAVAYDPLVRNLAAAGAEAERVIFPFEGHSWEQALTHALHEHMPGVPAVGWDNVNFSRFAISLYPARSEMGLRPIPDRVVTSGATFERILLGEGFPEDHVRRGCALRHAGIHDAAPAPAHDGPLRVLVATSIDEAQSVEQVAKAVEAFAGDERFELTVKCHPSVDAERVRALAGADARFSTEPIGELIARSDAMLYTYTVVCYEALAQGVPCVFVKSDTFIDLDQLEPFPDLRRAARTPEELREAVLDARSVAADEGWRERARAAVREAFAPVEGDCAAPFLDRM